MLPTIETPSNAASTGGIPSRYPEPDKVTEAYRTVRLNPPNTAVSDKAGALSDIQRQSPVKENTRNETGAIDEDQVELDFSLTREERDAFISAFSSKQDPATMSEEEKETLQKASDRIAKLIDDAMVKNSKNRERMEKALSEWYSRMSRGDHQGPTSLVNLIHAAAMGNLSEIHER